MEYADLVLVTVLLTFPLSMAVLVSLGTQPVPAIGAGSAVATAVLLHAMFVNPPRGRDPN